MKICSDPKLIERLLSFYEGDLRDALRSDLSALAVQDIPTKKSAAVSLLNMYLFGPEVAYVWGGVLAFSQLDIYRPYIAHSRRKSMIVCKGLKGRKISKFAPKGVPVFHFEDGFAPHQFMAACDHLHTAIYATNKVDNVKYLRENPRMVHILGLHGDSDKPSSVTRLSSMYDYVLAADANATNRVLSSKLQIQSDRVLVVGGAPIEGVETVKSRGSIKNILYAPTWEGYQNLGNFSSLETVAPLMKDHAAAGSVLRFRPHPGTGAHDKRYKGIAKDLKQVAKTKGKVADFNWSDVLIADVSGVISEYIYSRKPVVVPVDLENPKILEYINKTSIPDYCYLWDFRGVPLAEFLESISADPLWDKRMEKRENAYFGAETQSEVTNLFEQKLDLCEAIWKNRLMQKGYQPWMDRDEADRIRLPEDGDLAELVKSVMAGETMLELPERRLVRKGGIRKRSAAALNRLGKRVSKVLS